MDLQLHGKRALITGSYRGTGAGLARVMAREGAIVHVHGRTSSWDSAGSGGAAETLLSPPGVSSSSSDALG